MRRNIQICSRIFLICSPCTRFHAQITWIRPFNSLLNEFQWDSFTYAKKQTQLNTCIQIEDICAFSYWQTHLYKLQHTSRIWKSFCRNETRHRLWNIYSPFYRCNENANKKTNHSKHTPRPFNQRHSKNNVM